MADLCKLQSLKLLVIQIILTWHGRKAPAVILKKGPSFLWDTYHVASDSHSSRYLSGWSLFLFSYTCFIRVQFRFCVNTRMSRGFLLSSKCVFGFRPCTHSDSCSLLAKQHCDLQTHSFYFKGNTWWFAKLRGQLFLQNM